MTKGTKITLGIIGGILIILILFAMHFVGIFNQLVQKEEGVESSWAQVENVYQRRLDLIPNLVNTVKGYAAHEKETLQGVIEARSKATQVQIGKDIINDPAAMEKFQQMQSGLTSWLSKLMVLVERYPDLKANQNYLALQSQLEGTENRIAVERRRFNEAARAFNTFRRQFPNAFIASMAGFEKKAYFKADASAAEAPVVQF